MLLRRLVLENYGLYSGRHELDLVPRTKYHYERPIILVGGKNGAGKTTILEAIRLALYGRTSLGPRVRQVDYDVFLRGRVHRTKASLIKPTFARVGVEFDLVTRGERHRYFVDRAWSLSGKAGVNEDLVIRRDGELLDEVDREYWQSFVRDIVPEGLSQLFFFDGEKIKELADDLSGETALADAIKSLLGLDLVERLQADLHVYASREVARLGSQAERDDLARLRLDEQRLVDDYDRLHHALAETTTNIDEVQRELQKRESELRREGLVFAEDRERFSAEQAGLASRIEHAERQLREACEALFPLSLCPATATGLREQLALEDQQRAASYIRGELQETRRNLLAAIEGGTAIQRPQEATVRAAVAKQVQNLLDQRLALLPAQRADVHKLGLSESETQRLVSWMDEAGTTSRVYVHQLCTELDKAKTRLNDVEVGLARMPKEDVLRPVAEALGDLNRKLGGLQRVRDDRIHALDQANQQLVVVRRRIADVLAKQEEGEHSEDRLGMVHRIRSSLNVYLERLTSRKVEMLRETVTECFNRLCRKSGVIKSIDVDPKTFAVTLYDHAGTPVPKSELSSGEKQIYAIAMLWGLAKTSGRPLPVIIDTPLGRLDSDHRQNLVRHYFPHASHQVILLSTDTEVDRALYADLRKHVSHAYHLRFDHKERCTITDQSYFWKETEHA